MNNPAVNSIFTDYKAEVIAAEVAGTEGWLHNILISRRPSLERPHTKDIAEARQTPSHYDGSLLWELVTHREGLYEALPENIFHEPTLGSVYASEEEVLERIRRQRAEEAQARAFFAPFEQELTYLNVSMYALEKAICSTSSTQIIDVFAGLWPFLKRIDSFSARVFIHILPFLHRVKGDYRWMEAYLGLFTGVPVRISDVARVVPPTAPVECYTLGEQVLAESMLTYGAAPDGETDILIEIGPVAWKRMADFLPEATFGNILEELYQHFIPFNKSYRQVVLSPPDDRTFVLDTPEHAALGFSAYLA